MPVSSTPAPRYGPISHAATATSVGVSADKPKPPSPRNATGRGRAACASPGQTTATLWRENKFAAGNQQHNGEQAFDYDGFEAPAAEIRARAAAEDHGADQYQRECREVARARYIACQS